MKNVEDTATIGYQQHHLQKTDSNMYCIRFPYALFGLPFDPVSLDQTKTLIRQAIKTKKQVVIATPNVNFVALATKDCDFHQSILECDLSIVDGTPLFWLLKLLGSSLPEKVPGSSLIESLAADETKPPIRVFFFGGQDDTAAQASDALNKSKGGLVSVGALNPGFGSIETMSNENTLKMINDANPDFLIVSLGAQKGHKWIQRNRHKLNAPVISHLGAVVNFVAGTKKRSPKILQTLGLEWLWRIYQEPSLYSRYSNDALILVTLIVKCYIPTIISKIRQKSRINQPGAVEVSVNDLQITCTLTGYLSENYSEDFLQSIQKLEIKKDTTFYLDMKLVTYIDSYMAGVILRLIGICTEKSAHFEVINTHSSVKKMLKHFMVDI